MWESSLTLTLQLENVGTGISDVFLLNIRISVSRFTVLMRKAKYYSVFRIYFCLGQQLNFIFPSEYDNSLQVDNNHSGTYV